MPSEITPVARRATEQSRSSGVTAEIINAGVIPASSPPEDDNPQRDGGNHDEPQIRQPVWAEVIQSSAVSAAELRAPDTTELIDEITAFHKFGLPTRCSQFAVPGFEDVPVFTNKFWTSKQRAASSLHEVSYRACFKPQLPRFFIERLTRPGDLVYDPFMGRGTTLTEAALLGRIPAGCDVNPLGAMLVRPRLAPPSLDEVRPALGQVDWSWTGDMRQDLLVFYHPETLREICAIRAHSNWPQLSSADEWIRMVATSRLTGHSPGFFPFRRCLQIRLSRSSNNSGSTTSASNRRAGGLCRT